jgi:hypothetical protein
LRQFQALNTAAAGYESDNGEYDLSEGFNKVAPQMVNALSGVLGVSSEMKGSQRAQTMSFKSDNTHDNVNLAKVQNIQGKAMYSNQVKITAKYPRAAQLLDWVYLEPHSMVLADGIIYLFEVNYYIPEVMTRITHTEVSKEYVRK